MKVKLVNTDAILDHLQKKIRENHEQMVLEGKSSDIEHLNKTQSMYMGKYIAYEEMIDFMKETFESDKL